MQTERIDANIPGGIARAARFVQQGYPVVFPTDTLYGVGVDAFQADALERLYKVKVRPLEKGIPVLLSDTEQLHRVAMDVPALARTLIERFWPGPLTLVVPRRPELPANLSPNRNVAVRIPDHAVSRAFIRAAGGAIATSSANRSGAQPAATAAEAAMALEGLVPAVLDGGPVVHGISSTILDCTVSPPRVLRAGPIPREQLPL